MEKNIIDKSIADLNKEYLQINFPEYQREPNVWSRKAKQMLIDSIARKFDISSLYFYENDDGSKDCIDGRQRIGAIMSFLGEYPEDNDNEFEFKIINEIYEENDTNYDEIKGLNFSAIKAKSKESCEVAKKFIDDFNDYKLTIVLLSDSQDSKEFNLQFTRLNLGTIINAGEKLHAMVGEIRDVCFTDIGRHDFLKSTNVPPRRYARETLAAQVLAQLFSLELLDHEFVRTRHFDLQRFFKQYAVLDDEKKALVDKTRQLMKMLYPAFKDSKILTSRAVIVSTVLLAYKSRISTKQQALELAAFIELFMRRLKWQVSKGIDVDREYIKLLDFQKYITQASSEKSSVKNRAKILKDAFAFWKRSDHKLTWDIEYESNSGKSPEEECMNN